jgi:hypothetical protein
MQISTVNRPSTSLKGPGEGSVPTCGYAGLRSAQSSVDNCYRDQAVTNAAQLADLLRGADAPVVRPSG